MCALTRTMLPDPDKAGPNAAERPASPINFGLLKDLARLDGQRHGTLLGTSAATALLLQQLIEVMQRIACTIEGKERDPTGATYKPPGDAVTMAAATPAPAPAASSGIVTTLHTESILAMSTAVGGAVARTVQQPLAEIRGTLKTQGDGLATAVAAQAADGKRIDALEPHAAALQKGADAAVQRLDRLEASMQQTGQHLLKLHGVIGGVSDNIAGFEELTEALRRHVAALDVAVALVAAEAETKDDPPVRRSTPARKKHHS